MRAVELDSVIGKVVKTVLIVCNGIASNFMENQLG